MAGLKQMARDIAALFADRGWTWGGPSAQDTYVPDAVDVYAVLRKLVTDAMNYDTGMSCSQGRIVAEKSGDGGVSVFLSVGYIAENTKTTDQTD